MDTLAADLDTGKVSVQDVVLNVHPSGGTHYSFIPPGGFRKKIGGTLASPPN